MNRSLKELVLEKVENIFCKRDTKATQELITQLTDLLEECEGALGSAEFLSEGALNLSYSDYIGCSDRTKEEITSALKELQSYKAELAGEGKVE